MCLAASLECEHYPCDVHVWITVIAFGIKLRQYSVTILYWKYDRIRHILYSNRSCGHGSQF